ncbi:MAG: ABC transporter ATP-binding protein [Nitriliruptoraceae bacterium]
MIIARDLGFAYDRRAVLDGVDLVADGGEVLGLIGPNGSGKTTLLRTLYASLQPQRGGVTLDGEALDGLDPREVARRTAVVVQEEPGELPLTVGEMVLLGRVPHLRTFQRPSRHDHLIAAEALERVGARRFAERPIAELSGGERQRVLIARALVQQASHLLLDEPTNHLDIHYQHAILQLVRSLPVTTVVVLHDLNLAARYCDRLLLLDDGRVAAAGTPEEVLRPDVLEPVYGIGVERTHHGGHVQLLFHPLDETHEPTGPPSPVGTTGRENAR